MTGVRVRFLNRDEALSGLVTRAQKLLATKPNVLEVSLFGSLARGNHAPGSDADLYILLRDDSRSFLDRIPEFLDHFSGLGLPVEVFPYTSQEIQEMKGRGFIRTLLKERVLLASRNKEIKDV